MKLNYPFRVALLLWSVCALSLFADDPKPQTISFQPDDPVPLNYTVFLRAYASSGLPVTFTLLSGTGTLLDHGNGYAQVKNLTLGTLEVRAEQAGNAEYLPVSVTRTIQIIKAVQSIQGDFPWLLQVNRSIPFAPQASSGLPLSIALQGPGVLSTNTIIVTNIGRVVVEVTQTGNDSLSPVSRTYEFIAADQTLRPVSAGVSMVESYASDVRVLNNVAFLSVAGFNTQIRKIFAIDIANPLDPNLISSWGEVYGENLRAHGNTLMEAGNGRWSSGWNISDPRNPLLSSYIDIDGAQAVDFDQEIICFAKDDSLVILDRSDESFSSWLVASPFHIGTGANNLYINSMVLVDKIAYAGFFNSLHVIDLHDAQNPKELGMIEALSGSGAWPVGTQIAAARNLLCVLNPTNGFYTVNLAVSKTNVAGAYRPGYQLFDIDVEGDRAVFATEHGLEIIDLSDPSQPKLLGHAELPLADARAYKARLNGNIVVVTHSGVDLFDIADPSQPKRIPIPFPLSPALGAVLAGNTIYEATGRSLRRYTLNELNQEHTNTVPGHWSSIDRAGTLLYAVDREAQSFTICDASNSSELKLISETSVLNLDHMQVTGSRAYVWTYNKELLVFDLSAPAHPLQIGKLTGSLPVSVNGNLAFMDDRTILDLTNPAAPTGLSHLGSGGLRTIKMAGHLAFTASDVFEIFDISQPASPRLLFTSHPAVLNSDHSIQPPNIWISADKLLLESELGVYIMNIGDPSSPKFLGGALLPAPILSFDGDTVLTGVTQTLGVYKLGPQTNRIPIQMHSPQIEGGKLILRWSGGAPPYTLYSGETIDSLSDIQGSSIQTSEVVLDLDVTMKFFRVQ